MATSWARGAAGRAGVPFEIVSTPDSLVVRAESSGAKLVVLDLNVAGLNLGELVLRLKQLPTSPTVAAFGPHVQEGRLAAAAEAGCDLVMPRGQFHAQVDEILRQFATAH